MFQKFSPPSPIGTRGVTATSAATATLAMLAWNCASGSAFVAAQGPVTGPEIADRIVQRLDEVKQGLSRGDTGAKTQAAQSGLVDLLDQLATAAARQEAAEQGQGGGASAGAASQPKPKPAASPSIADDDPKPDKVGPQPPGSPSSDGPPGSWGKLPAQQRDAFLQSLREKRFPARYQRILEQYYRGFRGSMP